MQANYETLLMSSFMLWFDNRILTQGQAFTNHESKFYKIPDNYNGYYTYSAPFSQLVSDFSINGAQVPTGLYLNNKFINVGESGLVSIDYDKGQAYFSTGLPNNIQVSGRYAIKDVNIVMPAIPDLNFVFDNKFTLRPKINKSETGIKDNNLTYPVIFIRNVGGNNTPFAFGGLKETKTTISCYIFTDSLFNTDAVNSIIKDMYQEYVPYLASNELPLNNLGGFKNNINYNYTGLAGNRVSKGSGIYIEDVIITDFTKRSLFNEAQSLPMQCYFSVADFTLSKPRFT